MDKEDNTSTCFPSNVHSIHRRSGLRRFGEVPQGADRLRVERDALRELEQQLLRYTEDYQALPEQAEYVGDGTWRAWGNAFSAIKNGPAPTTGPTSAAPSARSLPTSGSLRGRGLPRRIMIAEARQ